MDLKFRIEGNVDEASWGYDAWCCQEVANIPTNK